MTRIAIWCRRLLRLSAPTTEQAEILSRMKWPCC